MMKINVIVLIISTVQVYGESDFFASVSQLEEIFHNEVKFVGQLEHFVHRFKENIDELKKKVAEVKTHRNNVKNIAQYLQNPINSFKYLRSINEFLTYIESVGLPASELINQYNDIKSTTGWPGQTDVIGAANAILRLQTTYNLDTYDLMEGRIFEYKTNPLTVEEILYIAQRAFTAESLELADKWLEKAFEMINNNKINDPRLKFDIIENYAYKFFMQGNLNRSLELTELLLELDPNHERALSNEKYLLDEINNLPTMKRSGEFMIDPSGKYDYTKVYYYLCQDKLRQNDETISQLKCQYAHHKNPYLRIGPAKEEEANLDPRIVIYKDVVDDSEIELMQNEARRDLHRSSVLHGDASEIRVSKVAWLKSSEHSGLMKILRRLSTFADLSHESSEDLQVVNYGLGGHYLPHYDSIEEESEEVWGSQGDRLATLLVYMNEVDEGGDTVFPHLGIKLVPEKGSMAVWYNLHPDGAQDKRTLHAACPVLLGTKWATNIWIHEAHNEFTKPCPLTR